MPFASNHWADRSREKTYANANIEPANSYQQITSRVVKTVEFHFKATIIGNRALIIQPPLRIRVYFSAIGEYICSQNTLLPLILWSFVVRVCCVAEHDGLVSLLFIQKCFTFMNK